MSKKNWESLSSAIKKADSLGITLNTDVFSTREQWQDYSVNALQTVERLAKELGIAEKLHLWPDKSLGNASVANRMPKPGEYMRTK